MSLDNRLIYVKWMDLIQPGNYIVQTGQADPATGRRARLLFLPENDMIARVRRCDYDLLIKRKRGAKVRQLDTSEVPENIRAVFGERAAKGAAAEASAKKPAVRKAKKSGKGA